MPGLNRVQLIGRLGKDPEQRYTPTGKNFTIFSLAVDRRWRGADGQPKAETDWFNIEAWGRLGEICQKYLNKGRLVFLEGRLHTDRYETQGEIKYFTKVILSTLQILDRPPQEEEPVAEDDLPQE